MCDLRKEYLIAFGLVTHPQGTKNLDPNNYLSKTSNLGGMCRDVGVEHPPAWKRPNHSEWETTRYFDGKLTATTMVSFFLFHAPVFFLHNFTLRIQNFSGPDSWCWWPAQRKGTSATGYLERLERSLQNISVGFNHCRTLEKLSLIPKMRKYAVWISISLYSKDTWKEKETEKIGQIIKSATVFLEATAFMNVKKERPSVSEVFWCSLACGPCPALTRYY